jgi:two-component system NarL family sensor kinase
VSSRDLRVLKAIAEALNGATNVGEALQTTLEQVALLLGLDAGWIWLSDAASGRFYSAVAQQLPPFLREPLRMTGQSCWCLRAFKDGELTAGNIDVMECSRLRAAVAARDRARTRGLRYHASVPLYFGARPLGIMNVAAPAWRRLTRRELDLLSTIASQVGVAIERARLAGESVVAARLAERTRLAREIHDTLAQSLTAIGLQIESAIDALPPRAAATLPLQRALELSRSALDEARGSIGQLRSAGAPPLPEALSAMAHAFAGDTGIRVHVRASGVAALAPAEEAEVLRIAAEALANVRRHAQATDVQISLTSRAGRLRLEIADNGGGFNPRARTAGFGILGMRERARALGGRLSISSAKPSRGARVILTMRGT